ncbi:hypothetical protein J3R30DRAFT_2179165 [Lentinula aciculospora]|uniref:Glycoside hydrolase 131 catalytic N-terminal domain-containing protein n=1 Tax=Lentinula aciculospora TaxID=153920 RepID=A0A9W9AGT4_9AGAR|nr:hypothetical protein J3R30DRAFT_2179165 [Lentinula aciculospora]
MLLFPAILSTVIVVSSTSVYWDGRVPQTMTEWDVDSSIGPYLTVVKGSEAASHYTTLLGTSSTPTPLWNTLISEQVISLTIDNSSIFVPGGSTPQNGFRRTDIIAQGNGSNSALDAIMEIGVSKFYFSVKDNEQLPLNYSHEYQIVFIEPSDGTHVFELQLGTPFSNPTAPTPAVDATFLKVRDHALNLMFETPFTSGQWHNFAVQIDWNNLTLQVFYSADDADLVAVTPVTSNPTASPGPAGQGDFHAALLKLPLVDPSESSAEQNDVVHYGIQEGTTEGLFFSGFFVQDISA